MELHVTKHAIDRYRERLCDFSSLDKQIIKRLKEIAYQGTIGIEKPIMGEEYVEVSAKGLSIVLLIKGKHTTVITCLGDATYRKWAKQQSLRSYVCGRIRFPRRDIKCLPTVSRDIVQM